MAKFWWWNIIHDLEHKYCSKLILGCIATKSDHWCHVRSGDIWIPDWSRMDPIKTCEPDRDICIWTRISKLKQSPSSMKSWQTNGQAAQPFNHFIDEVWCGLCCGPWDFSKGSTTTLNTPLENMVHSMWGVWIWMEDLNFEKFRLGVLEFYKSWRLVEEKLPCD